MRAGTAAGAWWRQRPEGHRCTDEALMQAIHTSTIHRQAKRAHSAIVRITILLVHRWKRVAEPYPKREGEYIISSPRRDQAEK